MSQILIFGSSSTQGYWDKEGGWADRLKKYIIQSLLPETKREIHVFNLGIAGQNSTDILQRFDFETKLRLRHPKTVFIFGFGGNDSQFLTSTQSVRTSTDKFSRNIIGIIHHARKYSNVIVFVGLHPVDETRTTPIPWETDINFKNDLIKQYNDIIQNVCKKEGVLFVDIYNKLTKQNVLQYISNDGLHPNTEGHKLIFENVKNFLISHNIISSI